MFKRAITHLVWMALFFGLSGIFGASYATGQYTTGDETFQDLGPSPNARGRAAGIVVVTPPWKHSNLSFDEALKCEPTSLARGYLELKYILKSARLAEAGGTVYTWANGVREMIDPVNAASFMDRLQDRAKHYAKAIDLRGYQRLHHAYDLTVKGRRVPTLVDQIDFEFRWTVGANMHPGVIVEDSVAIENATNPETTLIGKVNNEELILSEEAVGFAAKWHVRSEDLHLGQSDGLGSRYATAYLGRAAAFVKIGDFGRAVTEATEALDRDPDLAPAYLLRSQIRASCPNSEHRNGDLALKDAERYCAMMESDKAEQWLCRAILAAANAEKSNFDRAVSLAVEAVELAPPEQRDELRQILEGYRAGKPHRYTVELPLGR